MKTVVITVPILFPEDIRPHFPGDLNPEKAKAKLDELLAEGYRIKIMNDFVYEKVVFTHYVLEKMSFTDEENTKAEEKSNSLTLSQKLLGLWEQTVCEIRSEIRSWDLKGPHVSHYAEKLCDKLEHSMCALAGGNYKLSYCLEDE